MLSDLTRNKTENLKKITRSNYMSDPVSDKGLEKLAEYVKEVPEAETSEDNEFIVENPNAVSIDISGIYQEDNGLPFFKSILAKLQTIYG